MTRSRAWTLGAAVMGAAIVVPLLGACGSEGRNYQVPKALCGVPILDKDAVEDVLPGGDKITPKASSTGDVPQHVFCNIYIDNKVQIAIEGVWRASDFTGKDSAIAYHHPSATVTDHDRYARWEDGATTAFPCTNSKQKSGAFSVYAEAPRADGDMGKELQRFVTSFAPAWRKQLPCGE